MPLWASGQRQAIALILPFSPKISFLYPKAVFGPIPLAGL